MKTDSHLVDVLLEPVRLTRLAPGSQTLVLRQARQAGLLGFIAARIDSGLAQGKLADHLLAAAVHADYHDRMISWEMNRLGRVLAALEGPVVLLKGAAYKALDLGLAHGRLASDVDLLVPRGQLQTAEQMLLSAGWEAMKEDEYEQHYYREWMHELPPLRHRERGTVVDLHHAILPPTARLKPDSEKLIEAAQPMAQGPFFTLSPADTILHRAAHLFYDGDLQNALRELLDIHGLVSAHAENSDFFPGLVARARELDLARPLYYAVYFCRRILQTDIPQETLAALEKDAPFLPVRWLLQYLMEVQLRPAEPDCPSAIRAIAGWLLFLRSHWLRMPPLMLAHHLLTQVRRRGGVKTG